MNKKDFQFDVVILGGGPSGLMAAIAAAREGTKVALVEKNEAIGKKLLMTGNSRCNITQAEFDIAKFISNYGKKGKFLFSSFSDFGPQETVDFFEKNGLKLKTEKSGKIFPLSDKSSDVAEFLRKCLKDNGVKFFPKSEVENFEIEGDKISKVELKKGEIVAKNYILAMGGKSYPHTGSTGKGFSLAEKLGHKIHKPKPALSPIKIKEDWLKKSQGISLRGAGICVYQNGKKVFCENGDLIFTHFGLSGPMIINISRRVEDLLESGEVEIRIDTKPGLSFEKLDEVLRGEFQKNASKKLQNCMQDFYSPKFLELILELGGLDKGKHAGKISKFERKKIIELSKELSMKVEGIFGFDKAMVTSGGVDLKEIDSKTMQSKIVKNLFFAGEILDLDGPTGGYNLQICWSTGHAAGKWAAISAFE